MEIRQLQSFVSVVETGSFSIAAATCNITQSAVSQQIKALEEELDTTLLIRSTHKITLTEGGKALFAYAKRILKEASDCTEYISSLNNCMTGELRIGVGSFIEPYIRKAALVMMKRYPGVRLNVEFAKACRLNQMLREHKLDIAFTMNTAYIDEGIETEQSISFRIYAIMSKKHNLASKKHVSFSDIQKYPVIMPDAGDRVYATIRKHLDEDLGKLKVKAVVNSAAAILSVVDELNLITFLPRQFIQNRTDLVAIPIEKLEGKLKSNAHYMKDVSLKKSARTFLDIIANEIMPIQEIIENE